MKLFNRIFVSAIVASASLVVACGTEEESPPPTDGTGAHDAAVDASDIVPQDAADDDAEADGATPMDATEVDDGSAAELPDADSAHADTELTDIADGDTPDAVPNACVDDIVPENRSPCDCLGRSFRTTRCEDIGEHRCVVCEWSVVCANSSPEPYAWSTQIGSPCNPYPFEELEDVDGWDGRVEDVVDVGADAMDGGGPADDGSGESAGSGEPDVVSDSEDSDGSASAGTP
jgi:hypothetical protein